jgi:hypothetical protein
MSRYYINPLDKLSESQFQEFLIAKENDFVKITEMGKVIVDHYKWYNTYHNLQWHCYFNHKKICTERKVSLMLTKEIMDLLISEKISTLAINSETSKI